MCVYTYMYVCVYIYIYIVTVGVQRADSGGHRLRLARFATRQVLGATTNI